MNSEALDEAAAARLDEHGLPDAARGRVPFPLFADGLLVIVHPVLDAQHDHSFAGAAFLNERVRDIEFEWCISTFMLAEMFAIHPAVGTEIGGANCKDDPFFLPGGSVRNCDPPSVPSNFVAGGGAMIGPGYFERISKHSRRVIIVVPG